MKELRSSTLNLQRELQLWPTDICGIQARIRNGCSSALFCLTALLVLLSPLNSAWAQASPPSPSPAEDLFTLRKNVNMVLLSATTTDRNNTLVSGLNQDDFQVYEDKVLQQIKFFSHDDIPVTVGLVVDNSGSMKSKRTDVIAAALAFARSSNPQDQMFVVNFNEVVSFGLPDNTPFTDKVAQLEVALSRIRADGQTALYDAIAAALEHLKKGSRDKKVLIVISDGGDNTSKHSLNEIMTRIRQPDAIIYTIGIFDVQDADRNPRVLKRLAKDTGGEAFLPESLKDVAPICERIARDVRNQYTIAYVPTNPNHDGSYRAIQVKASRNLKVRTRTGYFTPSQSQPPPAEKTVSHAAHD